jgi:hypothetical protein
MVYMLFHLAVTVIENVHRKGQRERSSRTDIVTLTLFSLV